MKQFYTKLILLCLFFTAPIIADSCSNSVAPYFSNRSQSVNLPRMMSGWVNEVNIFDTEKFYGIFAITPGYSQSFREKDIARCLFGNSLQSCDCPTIKISGSRVSNRGNCDWLADYFGLPTDFQSSVTFKPRIQNFFIDFALHVGLDEWVSGMWFKVWAPFVRTRWDLNWCESCPTAGTLDYDPGYFNGVDGVTRSNLLTNAKEFFQERKTPTLGKGDERAMTFESLKSCRWGDCGCDTDLTKNGLADLRFAFGWNFFQNDDYHIGLGIIAAAPTGNRPEGCFLFEPIIGNGNHWEVGAVWTSQVLFWSSEDEEKYFDGYLDANITHLFKTRQQRCFDLCGKPLSRYMLAEKLGTPVRTNLFGNETSGNKNGGKAPSAQFKNAFAPVGNLTCSDVDVSVGVQADVVAMINYTCSGFSWDLGYNLWARSCEKIEFDCDCLPRLAKEKDTWALKGDAFVYGFHGNDNQQVALSGTQSNATINKGTNNFVGKDIDVSTNPSAGIEIGSNQIGPTRNPGVDNRRWTQTEASDGGVEIRDRLDAATLPVQKQTNTSVNPLFINQCDINLQGARTKTLTHSVFTHLSYSWLDNEDWTPFLGVGAQAEFSNNGNSSDCNKCCPTTFDTSCDTKNNCNSCCDSCQRCSVSQWYIWVKGGISFG